MSASDTLGTRGSAGTLTGHRWRIYSACIGLALSWAAIDQLTKAWAVSALGSGRVIDLGILDLRHVRNPGGAFSLPGFPGLFPAVTVVVLIVIARMLPRTERISLALAYGLVVGGAVGNVIDRIFRPPGFPSGHVVDFIDFRWWPVFNFADMAIVSGAILIVALTMRADLDADRATEEHGSDAESLADDAGA